jgi:hypothetical protein
MKDYKNKGLDVEEMRKRREEEEVQLRRSKRDEQLSKRRNINTSHHVNDQGNVVETDLIIDTPLELIIKGVYSPDISECLRSIRHIRAMLSVEKDAPISEIIDTGILPKIIDNLDHNLPVDVQFESAWILTNVASGSSYHTWTLVEHGAVPRLIQLIQSVHYVVSEQVLWALSNIAVDSYKCRDIVLSLGAMNELLCVLQQPGLVPQLKSQCVWTLSNFCRGKDPPPRDEIVFSCLPFLSQLVYDEDPGILIDACWTLTFLCEGSNKRIQNVINGGFVKRLVELLMHPNVDIVSPSLRAIGNILTGNDVQTQVVINCSALPAIQHLLDHPVSFIRKQSCWAISNATAGNKVQIQVNTHAYIMYSCSNGYFNQAVIDCDIVPKLLMIMDTADFKIRKEAAWAVLNITAGGTPYQIRYLVSIGTIPRLCDLLSINEPKLLFVTLEGIDNILKVGQEIDSKTSENIYSHIVEEANGVERIESLQGHLQSKIYLLASKIIDKYFNENTFPDTTTIDVDFHSLPPHSLTVFNQS